MEANYEPKFIMVTKLTDKDVRLIKETYIIAKRSNDYKTLNAFHNHLFRLYQSVFHKIDLRHSLLFRIVHPLKLVQ